MSLFAYVMFTGSVSQGGAGAAGLDWRYISGSDMTPVAGFDSPVWSDYRPLAISTAAEDRAALLLVTNTDAVISASSGLTYWTDLYENTSLITSQYSYHMPLWSKELDNSGVGTASTSSWQSVQSLDLWVKQYNSDNPGNEYYPGNYGWILGVGPKSPGTGSGWNVRAYFYGSPGSGGGSDPKGQAAFLALANSLPTGSYQTQANARDNATGVDAFNNIFNDIKNQASGTSFNPLTLNNYVWVINPGSALEDVDSSSSPLQIVSVSPF